MAVNGTESSNSESTQPSYIKNSALATFILSFLFFFAYLAVQVTVVINLDVRTYHSYSRIHRYIELQPCWSVSVRSVVNHFEGEVLLELMYGS